MLSAESWLAAQPSSWGGTDLADYQKPLPNINLESAPFWEGAKRHELLIQKCRDCGNIRFYPRSICPHCLSYETDWGKVSGRGRIYSFTVSYRARSPEFKADVPYNVAIVELEEGVRLMSNIVGCKNEVLRIGLPVEVVFEDVTPAVTIPKFKLIL
jgi:uncharacterized protein